MKKFDLKKFIAENKATFYSSLNEAEGLTPLQQYIYDYESEISGEETANEELETFKTLNTPDDVYEYYASERGWENDEDLYPELKSLYKTLLKKFPGLSEGKKSKKYYKDAEADDAEHIKALEKDMKDDKKASKMKVSELKAKIKEMVLSEMTLDIDNMEDASKSEVDFLAELEGMLGDEGYEGSDDHFQDTIDESGLWPALMKFKDEGFSLEHVVGWIEANWYMIKEADEKTKDEKASDEEAAADVTVDDTETTDVETTAEVDPNVKAVQDSLTQAQAAAQALGDKKLLDQIGNTITFFTRTHVVEKPGAVAEEEIGEGIHDRDITSASHTNIKTPPKGIGDYDPKKRAASLAKLKNFGPKK